MPFFLVILLTVGLDNHLVYPLALVTAGMLVFGRMPAARLIQLARRHLSVDLALLIWGIMVFSAREVTAPPQTSSAVSYDIAEG